MTDFAPENPRSAPAVTAPAGAPVKRIVGGIVALSLAGGALTYYLHARHFEDTDDAQIDGEISNIAPRVAGTVVGGQGGRRTSRQGGRRARGDRSDRLRGRGRPGQGQVCAQAEAQLAAEDPSRLDHRDVEPDHGRDEPGPTSLRRRRASSPPVARIDRPARRAARAGAGERQERPRREGARRAAGRAAGRSRSPSSISARRRRTAPAANVAALEHGARAARGAGTRGAVRIAPGATQRRLAEMQANAPRQLDVRRRRPSSRGRRRSTRRRRSSRQAELNLVYAKIVAPVGGIVGQQGGEPWATTSRPGQQIVAISPSRRPLGHRELPRDAAPRHAPRASTPRCTSTRSAATSTARSRASAARPARASACFPPENASGNYVKVVQRIPVRIQLDPGQPGMDRLRPGMSVEPKVQRPMTAPWRASASARLP